MGLNYLQNECRFCKNKSYINCTGRTSVWYFRPWTLKILLITSEATLTQYKFVNTSLEFSSLKMLQKNNRVIIDYLSRHNPEGSNLTGKSALLIVIHIIGLQVLGDHSLTVFPYIVYAETILFWIWKSKGHST